MLDIKKQKKSTFFIAGKVEKEVKKKKKGLQKNFNPGLNSLHRELIISNQVQKCPRQWKVTFKWQMFDTATRYT